MKHLRDGINHERETFLGALDVRVRPSMKDIHVEKRLAIEIRVEGCKARRYLC
jgi:hypothetical protein